MISIGDCIVPVEITNKRVGTSTKEMTRTFAPQVQIPWNQAHAPTVLVESFRKIARKNTILGIPALMDLIPTKQNKTKQNKLPSFIDRLRTN
jgi:hypothetical protein